MHQGGCGVGDDANASAVSCSTVLPDVKQGHKKGVLKGSYELAVIRVLSGILKGPFRGSVGGIMGGYRAFIGCLRMSSGLGKQGRPDGSDLVKS